VGTPPGTTTPAGTTTPTTTTPPASGDQPRLGLVLTFSGRARLAALLRNGLSGRLRCGKACTVKLTLRIPRSVARRLHLRTTVGTAKVTVSGSTAKRVRIRLTRSARTRLRNAVRTTLTLTGSARDAAGRSSTARKKIAVRR
jgi:hypothetical protein